MPYRPVSHNPIRHIVAVDGGYDHIIVREGFPSATICFFQVGALIFSVADFEDLSHQPFIDPEGIAKLKHIQRLKFVMPVRNVALQGHSTLTDSIRLAIHRFFHERIGGESLVGSLRWLVFREFEEPQSVWRLSSCPLCRSRRIPLRHSEMTSRHTFVCEICHGEIYLTDVLRLHERIDDELGASEILAYTITSIEQLLVVHLIKLILSLDPGLLEEILFIRDGPLAFFGPTLNLQRPMRALIDYLFRNHNLCLVGLEKSGGFVEHADEIANNLERGSVLILDNEHIRQYVLPGVGELHRPYGSSTYYSHKLIFKARDGSVYVASFPVPQLKRSPQAADFRNLWAILTNVERLRCDMYDSASVPVALVNKMVSLSHHPGSRILQRFATSSMIT